MAKKVLVATGTSVNKLKFAVDTIKSMAAARGAELDVVGANIYDVKLEDVNPDLIVVIGPVKFDTKAPIVSGMAFITKMGMEKTVDEILSKL
jgi:PTS system galactitol-specific IIB component